MTCPSPTMSYEAPPSPWNDKNNSFAMNFDITPDQLEKINSIDISYTTFIKSNLAIVNASNNTCIPNVFEAINVIYEMINNDISNKISSIQADIETMKTQIESLTPPEQ